MKLWVWTLDSVNKVSKESLDAVPHSKDVKYWLNTGLFYQQPSVFSFASRRKWLSKRREA